MDDSSAPIAQEPVPLLDLAHDWLAWLVLAADMKDALQVLFKCCHDTQDLVFSRAAVVPILKFRTSHDRDPQYPRALAMAEAATLKLHVLFNADLHDLNRLGTSWVDTCTRAASLHAHRTGMAQQPANVPYQLQCVSKATLEGIYVDQKYQHLYLDSLVPDFLVQACPNLRELTLNRVVFATSRATLHPTTCTSLKKLNMYSNGFQGGFPPASIKQQLLNLPSLTSLSVSNCALAQVQEGGLYHAACSRYSSQLRELELYSDLTHLPWSPGTVFPHLQRLALSRFSVDNDAVMLQLMQAASNVARLLLQSISGLKTSFAQQPCGWQELTLRDTYVGQLAKLPLSSCRRIVCGAKLVLRNSKTGPKPTKQQVAAGVAAVQAAGGLRFREDVSINLHIDDLHLIPAAAPLLEHLRECAAVRTHRPGTEDDAAWSDAQPVLTALGQHLKCKKVMMACMRWHDSPDAFACLSQLLPDVQGFHCGWASVEQLLEMCRTATRPFTLYLPRLKAYLKEQLEQAMQEAGHQLVTLEIAG